MSKIKLIGCDLDGTLMAPDHLTVTERTKNALLQAHNNGVKIAVATGRTLSVIYDVINQIPFADYVVYSNGAAVCDLKTAKTVFSSYMSKKAVCEVVDFFEKYPVYYEVYSGGCQYAQADKAGYFENNGLPEEFLEKYMESVKFCDNLCEFAKSNPVEKINLYYFNGKYLDEIRDYLFSLSDIDRTSPVGGDIEMTAKGVDKAYALEDLCNGLGISADEVMAFGDADNDIKMLSFAGLGVAMGNADEKCKKSADYVTLSNAEDGVAAAVEKFVLGKKPRLLVSACLLGRNCKYNGTNNENKAVIALSEHFDIVPVCPECLAGLEIPREPNEILNGRVVSKSGRDFTAEYNDGAEKTLYFAEEANARFAVMKERSPSCGKGFVYDGTFSGKTVKGNGIAAQRLIDSGILVFGESEIDKLLDEIEM